MIADAIQTVLFYGLAVATVTLALAVVMNRHLLRAAVCLMGVLTASACLYVIMGAEYMAGVQILVYVGGIVVLIVFTVMLTSSIDLLEDKPAYLRKVLGLLVAGPLAVGITTALLHSPFAEETGGTRLGDDTLAVGRTMLDFGPQGYVLPFEIISLLLLAAAIGGIVVARRTPPDTQPFTSGGDLPHEVDHVRALSQRERRRAEVRR